MNWNLVFLKISRVWLYLLVCVNFCGLMLFFDDSGSSKGDGSYLYASIVANVVVSYLVWVFMWLNRETLSRIDVHEINESFHEWIWFYSPSLERWLTSICFVAWTIPNIMHLFYLHGWLSWIVGMFFMLSGVWWLVVLVIMTRSYIKRDESLLLPQ